MSDAVFDTTVVAIGNKAIADRKPGNSFDKILRLLQSVINHTSRVRYNYKLRGEYDEHVKQCRNDVIEVFFTILDSPQAIRVARNSLSRQHYVLAVRNARWPSHDQHLIAAALDGERPHIYVTELRLERSAPEIHRIFGIRVLKI
jgi:xanthine/CO dehydrogenase XdhC/CoxF family maturation factor